MKKLFVDQITTQFEKGDETPGPGNDHYQMAWSHTSHSKREKSGPIYSIGAKTDHFDKNFQKRKFFPGPGTYGSRTTQSFDKSARSWKPIRLTEQLNRGSESARR